jgi:hypothetical protein
MPEFYFFVIDTLPNGAFRVSVGINMANKNVVFLIVFFNFFTEVQMPPQRLLNNQFLCFYS